MPMVDLGSFRYLFTDWVTRVTAMSVDANDILDGTPLY